MLVRIWWLFWTDLRSGDTSPESSKKWLLGILAGAAVFGLVRFLGSINSDG